MCTWAVDGWALTFGIARRDLDGATAAQVLLAVPNVTAPHQQPVHQSLGMCGIDFLISVRFLIKTWIRFGVWFDSVKKNFVRFRYYSYLLLM